MKKRILSIALTLILLVSSIPLPALAAGQSEPVNLGRNAVARMCKSGRTLYDGIENIFDGNRTNTRWSMEGTGWIFFTLPDPALLQYVRIYHAGSDPNIGRRYNTVAFDLEVLDEDVITESLMQSDSFPREKVDDDSNWIKVASVTDNLNSITTTPVSMTERRTMFRLNITDAGRDNTVRIYEVELFDTAPTDYQIDLDQAQASVDGKPVTTARPGETVTVTADPPSSPDVSFSYWGETIPENLVLPEPFSPTTTFIMPERDVYLTTEYAQDTTKHEVLVDNGTATFHGVPVTSAPSGLDVILTADPAPEGQTFDCWQPVEGYFLPNDSYSPTTTCHTPSWDIRLKATYKDAITQVSISDLDMPILGLTPDFAVTIPPDAPYHLATSEELEGHRFTDEAQAYTSNGVAWRVNLHDWYLSESYIFDSQSEGDYYAQIALVPNKGYAFAKDTAAITINGSESLVGTIQYKGDMLFLETQRLTAQLADPTERPITVEGGTAKAYGEIVTTSPGGIQIKLTADSAPAGQVFSHWEVLSGGISLRARPTCTFLMPTEPVHVRAVYGKPIESVSISDLTLPVLGATPNYQVTIPQDAPYHLATPEEMKHAGYVADLDQNIKWNRNGSFETMTPESVFYNPTPGAYYALIFLAPNTGYAFTETTSVSINGDPNLASNSGVEHAITIITQNLTAAPGPVMDYAVGVEGGTASVDGTPVTSARAGSTVTLTADPVPEGKIFLGWKVLSGHTVLADSKAISTTFTMFAEDFQVKAFFAQPITERVEITDMTLPVLGQHPDFQVTVPQDAPYHPATQEELVASGGFINVEYNVNGIWWENSDGLLTPEDVFDREDVDDYHARIILAPNEGYIFNDIVAARINGGSDVVRSLSEHRGFLIVKTVSMSAAPAPVQEYNITVEGGTASVDGKSVTSAIPGTQVTITASEPPEGYVFSHWLVTIGDLPTYQNTFNPSTLEMPDKPVKFEAVYDKTISFAEIKDLLTPVLDDCPDFNVRIPPDAPYHLATQKEVRNSNYGDYDDNHGGVWWKASDKSAILTPESVFTNPAEGFYFAQIVLMPNDGYAFDDTFTATINGGSELIRKVFHLVDSVSIVTVPLTAVPAPVTEYGITVENGTASVDGAAVTTAPADATVKLTAAPAPEGKVFDHWEVTGGEITLADSAAASTTFPMPAGAVAVKAVYKDAPAGQESIQIEFTKEGFFGQSVTTRTVTADDPAKVPSPGSSRCWLGADGSTLLFKGDRIDYAAAQALQSAAEGGVIRFHAVLREELPDKQLTVLFLDGQKEVGRTSLTVRLDTTVLTCAEALPLLPDGYTFAVSQDQSIQDNTVTFQVEAISAQTSAPIQLTLKMRSLFWRLENGQRSMTVTLQPGDSLVLPGAQKRNGTTCDVLWSCDEMQARSGDSLSYEVLMQYLSSLPSAADDLVLRGKTIRG